MCSDTVTKEPEFQAADGTTRKLHYGSGRQPWDDICDLGWGPIFAAGNALKYVRRYTQKNGLDDLEKGRWYYARLVEMCATEMGFPARMVKLALDKRLTESERRILRGEDEPNQAAG